MRNNTLLLLLCLITGITIAQDFQGIATYKSHRKFTISTKEGDENSAMRKQIEAQLKKQFQQEYKLEFTREASL